MVRFDSRPRRCALGCLDRIRWRFGDTSGVRRCGHQRCLQARQHHVRSHPRAFKLIGVGGTVLADSTLITVEPGDIVGFSINAPTQRVYCRFIKASRSKVRAVIATFSDADDHTDHVLAVAQ